MITIRDLRTGELLIGNAEIHQRYPYAPLKKQLGLIKRFGLVIDKDDHLCFANVEEFNNPSCCPVRNSKGETFESIYAAAKAMRCSYYRIRDAVRFKRKFAGMAWERVPDVD